MCSTATCYVTIFLHNRRSAWIGRARNLNPLLPEIGQEPEPGRLLQTDESGMVSETPTNRALRQQRGANSCVVSGTAVVAQMLQEARPYMVG